jgi:glyoxylate reductase
VVQKVVSTSRLPLDVSSLLGDGVVYIEPAGADFGREDLLREVGDADALISLLTHVVDAELFEAAPRLKVVANFAVGYDNVDVAEATRRGIMVANTPDVLTETTADLTFALLLASARRLVEGDALVRSGTWAGWAPDQLLGSEVHGSVLGVVGMGRIGTAVARRALGFGMSILYAGPRAKSDAPGDHVPLRRLLEESDFVSLHCPLNDSTRKLINAETLAWMKPTAILVNTSRGGCVDEAALAQALENGGIGAAALDVFAAEPAVDTSILRSPRVTLAPHMGSATTKTRTRMGQLCVQAVKAALDGRAPDNLVNREVVQ